MGEPLQPSAAPIFLGLDTASVDENLDPNWAKAKLEGPLSFGIIRSNYGTWPDSSFARDWPKIKDAGMVRGAYLFLRFPPFGRSRPLDPAEQATAAIHTIGDLAESDLPPTLDVEFPGGAAHTQMSSEQLLDGVRAAWRVLKDRYKAAPIIYTSGRVWREELRDIAAPDLIESPLWLARYPFNPGPAVHDMRVSTLKPPPVPRPWGEGNWWIHQYQGDARGFPGFRQIDMNRFNAMTKGATGERVKWVQRRLGIAQTGAFDSVTEAALGTFQQRKGLVADLIVDPRTFAFLCWSNP
jgi:GH25 family lysozyme M1 (1,4-beta-N-acetylmuramidase)